MTNPITPYKRTVSLPLVAPLKDYYAVIDGWSQTKPFDLILPYNGFHLRRLSGNYSAQWNYNSYYNAWWLQSLGGDSYESSHQAWMNTARTFAVGRFNSKRGATASLGVALAEANQTVQMVTKRVTQLAKAANALRKFRFYDAAEALGLLRNKRPRRKLLKGGKLRWTKHPIHGKYYPRPVKTSNARKGAHAFSNTWLEWAFGWAPAAQDISSCLEVLDAPLAYESPVKVVGAYSSVITREGGSAQPGRCVTTTQYKCRIQAVLSVSNPNRDLARRLGLVNLGTIVWELVPFSFLLGWVSNVDAWLRQFNEFYGVEVKNPMYTDFVTSVSKYEYDKDKPVPIVGSHTAHSCRRVVGSLPNIRLGLRPAYQLSVRRAITASSLLVQVFTSGRSRPVGVG